MLSILNTIILRTKEEIIGFLYNHIKAVNQIYEVSDFGGIRGINFAIQRITVSLKMLT